LGFVLRFVPLAKVDKVIRDFRFPTLD
jgi:hypothetical protein